VVLNTRPPWVAICGSIALERTEKRALRVCPARQRRLDARSRRHQQRKWRLVGDHLCPCSRDMGHQGSSASISSSLTVQVLRGGNTVHQSCTTTSPAIRVLWRTKTRGRPEPQTVKNFAVLYRRDLSCLSRVPCLYVSPRRRSATPPSPRRSLVTQSSGTERLSGLAAPCGSVVIHPRRARPG
jgi:hypothetical protein